MNIIKSYGICCCRQSMIDGIEILLIKKTVTYNFCEFVHGRYKKYNAEHLIKLFSGMTFFEKKDILSLNFSLMWYRVYNNYPEKTGMSSTYLKKKNKFEISFLHDSGILLNKLINGTINVDTIWEIPKGRKDFYESDIETAIREFTEETNIEEAKYKLELRIKPYIETFIDFGITYQNIYYYATAVSTWEPNDKFNNKQTDEISDIKWTSINRIKQLKYETKSAYNRNIKKYKKIIKRYQNG